MRLPWRRGNAPRRSTCSSSGSATRAASTRATGTTSASWSPTSSRGATAARWRAKFSGRLAEVRIDEHRVGLLKPETYMNESGRSVQAAAAFFKLEPDAMLVVHDESDLELGRLQARLGGGLAGHNGLRSVSRQLGTPTSCACASASAGPGAATAVRSPTTCSRTSSRTSSATTSSSARRTRSRRSTPKASRRRSAPSTDGGAIPHRPVAGARRTHDRRPVRPTTGWGRPTTRSREDARAPAC